MRGMREILSPFFCTHMEKSHREFLISTSEYDRLSDDNKRLIDMYTTKISKPWIWIRLIPETQDIYERKY